VVFVVTLLRIGDMNEKEEVLEIVDTDGNVTGCAPRSKVHGNPSLVHRVVHVLVFDGRGRLLLQKRSLQKDVAPGKWDTSVGGHVNPGEDLRDAARREAMEELGVSRVELQFLYRYLFSNHIESELVCTFSCVYEGEIRFNETEIDEVRYWTLQEIQNNLGTGIFSGHFESEIKNYLKTPR
jgi:isopentenyl-diphosphate delta-isomerase type 1